MKVISVVGHKKSGKTTLVAALVQKLSEIGTVGTVKHMGEPRLNPAETDTGKHFDAGADTVIGITGTELVSFSRDSDLEDALDMLCYQGFDFAVVEGFKNSSLPKIVLGDLQGVSNIVFRMPENLDLCEDLTDSLIGITLSQPDQYTLEALIKKVRGNPAIQKPGSIGTFTGIVRELDDDEKTIKLEFEKYESEASNVLDKIREDLKKKEGILEVILHHKTGVIKAGEDVVYVVITSGHRKEFSPALSEAIERIKAEVPIWKKEFTEKEEFWFLDKEQDRKQA